MPRAFVCREVIPPLFYRYILKEFEHSPPLAQVEPGYILDV